VSQRRQPIGGPEGSPSEPPVSQLIWEPTAPAEPAVNQVDDQEHFEPVDEGTGMDATSDLDAESNEEGDVPNRLATFESVPLQNMDLSYNDLERQLPDQLSGGSSLRVLILDDNRRLTGELAALYGLTALEILRLDHCKFTGSLPLSIYGLTSLQDVRLIGNALSGPISTDLSNLSNLIK
jgi:Leucine-rich repeat (LRR) protein